ncbi:MULTISPECIES: DUF924 family protein [unclassified Jeotgalibaca]|uniref:DUF924 family protein n=1 Tax=unclassified Jeotgalibaca TaxID=2621505 RepID=UPI003FD35BB4
MKDFQTVLDFWFDPENVPFWFEKNEDFDKKIYNQFYVTWQSAIKGEYWHWRETIKGRLAEIIVLDQFSRNLCRDDAKAYAQDTMALVLSQEAIKLPDFNELTIDEKRFLLMPFMHSESSAIHKLAVPLFKEHTDDLSYEIELQHQAIIERFGYYPHRNEARNQTSTPEEIAFMEKPGNTF